MPVGLQYLPPGNVERLGRCHALFLRQVRLWRCRSALAVSVFRLRARLGFSILHFRPLKLTHVIDQTTPPLCSAPITGTSTLVRVAPPLTGASVFLLTVFTACRFPTSITSQL